jgi:hypothetical protein
MPPRYAYWTILIDNKPTAFRARNREELLPTLHQLQRKNPDAVMRWFARGRLWDTPEQAQWARTNLKNTGEKRGRDWRPGGQHKDPRLRFQKRRPEGRPVKPFAAAPPPAHESPPQKRGGHPTTQPREAGEPLRKGQQPWHNRPPRYGRAPGGSSHQSRGEKPAGAPSAAKKRGGRSWRAKPRARKPWSDRGARFREPPVEPLKHPPTGGPKSPDALPATEQTAIKPEPPERG